MPRLFRFARAALAALALLAFAVPSYAGPAETAFLQTFVGTWQGSANLTGATKGKVTCKIVYKASGAKVNFSGRCSVAGEGSQSFSGAMSYNDAKKQYESKASGKVAVGTKSGNTITFTNSSKSVQGSSSSRIQLSPGALVMDTSFTDSDGKSSSAHLVLKKS